MRSPDVPPKRTKIARAALRVADDLTVLIESGQGIEAVDDVALFDFLHDADAA